MSHPHEYVLHVRPFARTWAPSCLCAPPHELQVESPNSRKRWTASSSKKSQSQNFQREFGTCQTLAYNPNSRQPQHKINALARLFSFPRTTFRCKKIRLTKPAAYAVRSSWRTHNAESARICHAATGTGSAQSGRHGTPGTRRSARTSVGPTRKSRIRTPAMAPHRHRRFHRQSFQALLVARVAGLGARPAAASLSASPSYQIIQPARSVGSTAARQLSACAR